MSSINPNLTTHEALEQWLLDFHKSTATLDAKFCADKFFTSDVEIQYANNPVVQGRENAQSIFNAVFQALDSMTHDIVYFDFVTPDKLYQATTTKYVVKGDDPVKDMITIPAMLNACVVEENERLMIRRAEIFLDVSAVFARMKENALI